MFMSTFIGVVLSLVIIGVWGYIGVLTFALYSTALTNHNQMRMFYTIAVLNIMQAMLGIYFIVTGNGEWQQARWVAFSLIEIAYLSFVMGAFRVRWLELAIRTLFYVLVLVSVVISNVWLNILIALILAWLAFCSQENLIIKYFTWIFGLYAFVHVVPEIVGYTTNGSLFMGVIYTCAFAYGAKQLYEKEKVSDAIDAQIRSELEAEFRSRK
jgi:hypothetical protein